MANVCVGDQFGRWTVISLEAPRYRGRIQVRVKCECGMERIIPVSALVRTERPSRQCQNCAQKAVAKMRFGTRNFY